MSREWYVFKVGKREDTTRPRIAQAQGAIDLPGGARLNARRGNNQLRGLADVDQFAALAGPRRDDEGPQVDAAPTGDQSYGFEVHREDRNSNYAFTGLEAAQRWAKEQAELTPKTLFGVFECVQVFETTKPSVVEKKYNDAGELLVVEAT